MHDARVVVRDGVLIGSGRRIRYLFGDQESGAVQARTEPGYYSLSFVGRVLLERAGAAAEDVGGRGLVERLAADGQDVVGDVAVEGAKLSLGVDGEGLVGVFGPDLGDVRLVVATERIGIHYDAGFGAQRPQVPPIVLDDQRAPAGGTVAGILGSELGANAVEALVGHAGDVLDGAQVVLKRQRDGQRHKIHVADVHENLVLVVGEFGKPPIEIEVWVRRIGHGGFDKFRTRI